MKFSEIEKEQWDELKPYLDTCLLPITGLDCTQAPYEVTEELEQLRDIMDLVEIPYKGRIVTYPACHYSSPSECWSEALATWCQSLKSIGYKYVILITANPDLKLACDDADLIIQAPERRKIPSQLDISQRITTLWSKQNESL